MKLSDADRPPYAHVPGRNAHPSDGPAHRAARAAPAHTDPGAWAENRAYLTGAALYAEGYYWEAHEVWEAVWMAAAPNSRERNLLQSLIQLANAALKLRMERRGAARRLAVMALTAICESGDGVLMGVDLSKLRVSMELFSRAPDLKTLPKLQYNA